MVKIYGDISDSEQDFFDAVNSRFKIIKINSIKEYSDFSKNPHKKKKEIIKEKKENIENKINEKRRTESRISELKNGLKKTNYGIYQTTKMVKKYYGRLKEEKQLELESLRDKKKEISDKIERKKQKLRDFDVEIKKLYKERYEAEKLLKEDIKTLYALKEDINIKKKLQGAYGERQVIKTIKNDFEKEKDYHLINAFNIDLLGKSVRYDEKIQTENKIDHILICPKGIFVIETKYWKTTNEKYNQDVINQVKRTKIILSKTFPKEKNFKFVILTVGKEIHSNISSIKSIPLEDFKSFVLEKETSLKKEDIVSILCKFLPYLNSNQINRFSKTSLKFQKGIIKGKRFIGKLFKK